MNATTRVLDGQHVEDHQHAAHAADKFVVRNHVEGLLQLKALEHLIRVVRGTYDLAIAPRCPSAAA